MKVAFYANTEWYLFNFRLPLARALLEAGHDVVAITPPGPYGPQLERAGLRWRALPLRRRSISPALESAHVARLCRELRLERPDLLHSFTVKCVVYGALAARMTGLPAVINSLDGLGYVFSSPDRKARLLSPIISRLLRRSTAMKQSRIVLQNAGDREFLLSRNIAAHQRIRLIEGGVGVDTERFKPVLNGKRHDPPRIVFASRLLKEKGIEEFVAAAQILRRRNVACRFVVAGNPDPGNPGSVSQTQLAEWREIEGLDLIGHTDDMPGLLASADIVVLVTDYGEGVPRILIESAACGVPVITSDQAGCREIVDHGENGLVVRPRDPVALADAVQTLLADNEMRAAMGRAGRCKVVDKFDERAIIARTLDVYRELQPSI